MSGRFKYQPFPPALQNNSAYVAYRAGIEINHLRWLLWRQGTGSPAPEGSIAGVCQAFRDANAVLIADQNCGLFLEDMEGLICQIQQDAKTTLKKEACDDFIAKLNAAVHKCHFHQKAGPRLYAFWNVGLLLDMALHPMALFPNPPINNVTEFLLMNPPAMWHVTITNHLGSPALAGLGPTPLWPLFSPAKISIVGTWIDMTLLLLRQAKVSTSASRPQESYPDWAAAHVAMNTYVEDALQMASTPAPGRLPKEKRRWDMVKEYWSFDKANPGWKENALVQHLANRYDASQSAIQKDLAMLRKLKQGIPPPSKKSGTKQANLENLDRYRKL